MWGIRFSPEQREQIDAYAHQRGIPRAEAVRRLVVEGIGSYSRAYVDAVNDLRVQQSVKILNDTVAKSRPPLNGKG